MSEHTEHKASTIKIIDDAIKQHKETGNMTLQETYDEICHLRTQNTELQRQLAEAQAESKLYRDALQRISDGGYGSGSKGEQCKHDKYSWEDCEQCIHEIVDATLAIQPSSNVLELVGYCDEDFILMGDAIRSFTVSKKQHDENTTPLYRLKDK